MPCAEKTVETILLSRLKLIKLLDFQYNYIANIKELQLQNNIEKALFLDRDGIINVDHGYVYKIEDFEFTQGIFELLQLFTKHGYLLFIITNQSGIGRGYYTQKDFHTLTEWMIKTLYAHGVDIKEVQHCPHRTDENCHCRKPETGMIDEILKKYPIDLEHSWLIGDKQTDIDLAHNAGVGLSIAIGSRGIQNSTYSYESVLQCKESIGNIL